MEQRLEEELRPLGIRVRHFLVLAMLGSSGTLSQQDMAGYLLLDPTLMVGLVDDLEARGLCERARDPRDRRRYSVAITEDGRALHRRAGPPPTAWATRCSGRWPRRSGASSSARSAG